MQGDFLSRRRTVGTLTLLLACVCAAGWLRSLRVTDQIDFPVRSHATKPRPTCRYDVLIFDAGSIIWVHAYATGNNVEPHGFPRIWHRGEYIDLRTRVPIWVSLPTPGLADLASYPIQWIWRWRGLAIGQSRGDDGAWERIVMIPYWWITSSLLAGSAWLLLSKPRRRPDKATAELSGSPSPQEPNDTESLHGLVFATESCEFHRLRKCPDFIHDTCERNITQSTIAAGIALTLNET